MKNAENCLEDHFYGTATVGERGQVVIPAEARKKMGIDAGDKMLVLGNPHGHGVFFCKIDAIRDMSAMFSQVLENLEILDEPEGGATK